jgi:dienelactone hydrolase
MAPARSDIEFEVRGLTLRGWHYQPQSDALKGLRGTPAVVMAHGLSMPRDGGLEPFAERFAEIGCHVLVFDYRCFGDSEGEPRELVSINQQLEDFEAAIGFMRRMPEVDPTRVALWGTSYSGGHVVELASRDSLIAAVVSQVPNLDSLASLKLILKSNSVMRLLWLVWMILADFVLGLFGRVHYITSIAPEGGRASYLSDEGWEQVQKIKGPAFKNRFAPRDFIRLSPYRPGKKVSRIHCRVLFVAADRDDLTPSEPVYAAARAMGDRAELVSFPINHFGAYVEPTLSESLVKQGEFLARELAPAD